MPRRRTFIIPPFLITTLPYKVIYDVFQPNSMENKRMSSKFIRINSFDIEKTGQPLWLPCLMKIGGVGLREAILSL
jgi:hypothetical protein